MDTNLENSRRSWSIAAVIAPLAAAVVVLAVALILNAPDEYSLVEALNPALGPSASKGDAAVMILACPLLVIWCASAYRRCFDAPARTHIVVASAMLVAWMVAELARYMCTNVIADTMLWYFMAVPVNFVPLMCLLVSMRLAYPGGATAAIRGFQASAIGISVVLALFVFTNPIHFQVFTFDLADSGSVAYCLNWGFWLVTGWSVVLCIAFLAMLFKSSVSNGNGALAPVFLIIVCALVLLAICLLNFSGIFVCGFSLAYSVMFACCMETMYRLGIMSPFASAPEPSAHTGADEATCASDAPRKDEGGDA